LPEPAASVADVVKIYRVASGEVRALRGVSASFDAGALSAVVGPSGSGKSSLLRLLAGIDRPTSGTVRVQQIDVDRVSARARRELRHDLVGYVFQQPSDNLFPHLTIDEHLRMARPGRRRHLAPDEVVAALGIGHRLRHRASELSGGEQQRAAVAIALCSGASVILADEPTAQLDHASGAELIAAMRTLAGTGVAFVVATHDPSVRDAAEAVVELDHGLRVTTRRSVDERTAPPWMPGHDVGDEDLDGSPVLSAVDVTKTYRRGDEEVRAVERVDLQVAPGELVTLRGVSGSGKTTLLHLLAGWELADAGSIRRPDGASPPAWRELAILPQKLGLLEELTVRENVEFPARLSGRLEELGDAVEGLLERLGLTDLADRHPVETSVGEQQRTALARAILLSPAALLVDEPTGHQDAAWATVVLEELERAVAAGSGCLAATHDPLARRFADRELSMADGRLLSWSG
jgi:putative ABC transport system ATP-binding protein